MWGAIFSNFRKNVNFGFGFKTYFTFFFEKYELYVSDKNTTVSAMTLRMRKLHDTATC